MKYIFLFFVLLLIACKTNSEKKEQDGYIIEGYLTNFKDSTLLLLQDLKISKTIDSTFVIDNKFTLSGKVMEPGQYILQTKFDPNDQNSFKYFFFWIDNSNINITGDFENFKYAKVEGSELHKLAQELGDKQMELDKRRELVVDSIQSEKGDRQGLIKEMHRIDSIRTALTMQFIRTKPNNPVSIHQLTFFNDQFTKEELGKIYNSLDEDLKESTNGKVLRNYLSIDKILEKGDDIAEVKGSKLNGDTLALSDIIQNNEYTILDFWAAGCGPCRMQSKQYTQLYEKYKDKGLEIVSFSLDKNRKDWERASKEDNISWINISDLMGANAMVPMTYGVKGIPNSFLINKKGVIVAELLGFDTENPPFSKELTEFFD